MIKVYSIPDCPWCQKVKKYLELRQVKFQEVNIESDLEGRKELLALTKQLSVPVTSINGRLIVGFEREELDEALATVAK
ncbi:glutaredoxin domain-containing protein [Anaeromusa sp.]|jgi:glutaredoxin 3|uniref:glutaredoxin family protein n=1 Tax=Anaeromusa sp. TaxID=1872520 RepID=UPI0026042808|nr:glutaredoxin domain-containing protein [Anaeromusa sp.]MDD3158325.1 glutaredoxin domain-containing protein [Anaeromusa sp.]NCB77739.1 NrdH-redoxin [Negativicutes bacterium]